MFAVPLVDSISHRLSDAQRDLAPIVTGPVPHVVLHLEAKRRGTIWRWMTHQANQPISLSGQIASYPHSPIVTAGRGNTMQAPNNAINWMLEPLSDDPERSHQQTHDCRSTQTPASTAGFQEPATADHARVGLADEHLPPTACQADLGLSICGTTLSNRIAAIPLTNLQTLAGWPCPCEMPPLCGCKPTSCTFGGMGCSMAFHTLHGLSQNVQLFGFVVASAPKMFRSDDYEIHFSGTWFTYIECCKKPFQAETRW